MAKKASASDQGLEGPLHVVSLRTENIRNLALVELEFKEGEFLPIIGGNGAGKSTVLDSMMYALSGKKAQGEMPVKQGEKRAEIVLTLDGPKGKIRCTRKFQPSGNQEWSVVGEDGTRYASPEELMESLIGPVSFDPSKFLTAEPAAQRRMLLAAAGHDSAALEGEIKRTFQVRADANRDLERAEAKAKALGPVPADEAPDVEGAQQALSDLTAGSLRRQLVQEKIDANKAAAAQNRAKVEDLEADIRHHEEAIAKARAEVQKLMEARPAFNETHKTLSAELAGIVEATPEAIREAKDHLAAEQAKLAAQGKRETIEAAHREVTVLRGHQEEAEADLAAARKALADAVAGALPIKGMSCDEKGTLFLHDRPLSEHSTGEKLTVATAIALKHQPQIRLMQIRDASLLSAENVQRVAALAKKHDLLILAEFVQDPHIRPAIIMRAGEARVEQS